MKGQPRKDTIVKAIDATHPILGIPWISPPTRTPCPADSQK